MPRAGRRADSKVGFSRTVPSGSNPFPSPVIERAVLGVPGGSVVLNVLKEELPDDQDSRFWPFALGAAAYSALLLAVWVALRQEPQAAL